MLSGEKALLFIDKLGDRVIPSPNADQTDKMRCFILKKTTAKVQLFFDVKTTRKCSFRFDYEIPKHISGIKNINKMGAFSTAIERCAFRSVHVLYKCDIEREENLEELIKYFEAT